MSYGYAAPYGCAPVYALPYQPQALPGPAPPPIAPIPNNIDIPVDPACYRPPQAPSGQNAHYCVNEPTIVRCADQHFNTCNTSVQENNIHIQHNRTVVTNVNRNHHHLHRIIIKDNNYHHFLTKNIIRAHDIHHQRIERVKAEGKTFKDFKETVQVEPVASCSKGSSKQVVACLQQAEANLPALAPAQTPAPCGAEQTIIVEQGVSNPPEEAIEIIGALEQSRSTTPVSVPVPAALEYHPLPPPPANPPPFDPDRYLSDSEDEDEESARILAIAQQAQQMNQHHSSQQLPPPPASRLIMPQQPQQQQPRYAQSYDYQHHLQSPQVAAAAAYYQYHTQNRYQPQIHQVQTQPNYYGY